MKLIQFDTQHFNAMMSIDGQIHAAVNTQSKQDAGLAAFAIGMPCVLMLLLPFGLLFQGKVLSAIALLIGIAIFLYCIIWEKVLRETIADIFDMKTNNFWYQRMIRYSHINIYYDDILNITIEDMIDDLETLRTVYFNTVDHSTYIPIEHIQTKPEDLTQISFDPVPDNYLTVDHFKHQLPRPQVAQMVEKSERIQPTFTDVVQILQLQAKIQLVEKYGGSHECNND